MSVKFDARAKRVMHIIIFHKSFSGNRIFNIGIVENIIETRYLNIFRFFNSKYSSLVLIHLLQRLNSV